MSYLWAEPFAGAAAVALRLVGGRALIPPVSWMGGKRRLARDIANVMGVPSGRPSRVLLADAGPPYVGCTGYGWDSPRAEVLELARVFRDAGAVVAVSEAEALDLEGWHHVELTLPGGKPEWLTVSRPPARLPERLRQGRLFA